MITVGFTYDLRDDYLAQGFSPEEAAEFDSRETIAAIDAALQANGYKVDRVGNVKALVNALAMGRRWDIVFNICEGVKGIGRETQVPALLEAYEIPAVFSTSDVMALCMNKALAKLAVGAKKIPTAPFFVVADVAELQTFNLPFPVFVKPLAEGTGKGIGVKSLVDNKKELKAVCASIIKKFDQPALVETFLPGIDMTVGILGSGEESRAIGVMKAVHKKGAEPNSQTYYNKENWKKVLAYEMVDGSLGRKAADIALKSWKALGCFDGGRVDLRCDADGVPNFIEVNPLAGLRPAYSDLPLLAAKKGMAYDILIGRIMESALRRYGLFVPHQRKKRLKAAA